MMGSKSRKKIKNEVERVKIDPMCYNNRSNVFNRKF